MSEGMVDYTRGEAGSAIGARLRRLSEAIDRDATRTYGLLDVQFEQRWFAVLNQLVINGPMSVGDIAAAINITHVSVSQARKSLEKAGYITGIEHETDARRKLLVLTPQGEGLVKTLTPLWRAQFVAADKLNDEAGDLASAIGRIEDALERLSLFDRIAEELRDPTDQG